MQTGLLFMMAALSSALENAPAVGVWSCSLGSEGGLARSLEFELTTEDGRLTGVAREGARITPISALKFDGKLLCFHIPDEIQTLRVKAEVSDGLLEGEWADDGVRGFICGVRA